MNISWLLFTHSGRNNWVRLALTMIAVALGVVMVLVFTTGINALDARNTHINWRKDIYNTTVSGKAIQGIAPLKARYATGGNLNKWQNRDIYTVSLRASDGTSPQLPGLSTPNEGEYYVSRGLAEIIRTNPDVRLGERFGAKQVGIIPDALSTSPDALEVIRGMSAQEASDQGVSEVYKFTNNHGSSVYTGIMGIVMLFGATILLFPIVLFISIATQLGSAQREKRYAALRLIGATRKQVTNIIATESLVAALIGIVLGSIVYAALLPLLSQYYFEGMRFWIGDITVPQFQYILVIGLTLAFCLFANWWGMRHVQLSPLGIARSQRIGRQPRVWRFGLLAIGLAIFVWLALPQGRGWFKEQIPVSSLPIIVLMIGIFAVLFGLLLAGPWLTNSFARLFARFTAQAPTLLAAKRIAVQSKRVFRSVSGVVLALFAGSFYITGVSGITGLNASALQNNGYSQLKPNVALISSPALPAGFDEQLARQPYVKSVAAIDAIGDEGVVISCKTLALYTEHACPSGRAADQDVRLNFDAPVVKEVSLIQDTPTKTGVQYLIDLDSNGHLDQLRTLIAGVTGLSTPSYVISGTYAQEPILNPIITELAGMAYAGMGVTLFVAVASLIVSTIGGLLERQRSFATLRLSGMTIAQMKRTVNVESLVPLFSVSLLASGLGVWIGVIFTSMLSQSATPGLTPLYFILLGGSLVVAAVAIQVILPMLDRITRPEENQTE